MSRCKVLALILAGGRVGELSVLTLDRPKSAMPFAGMYRVIDCAMTNITDSGIEHIGILSQYRPLSLMDHIGAGKYWDLLGTRRGVWFLPPHTRSNNSNWYKGTADAVYQNISFIQGLAPEFVMIVSGDHIYRMSYESMLDFHQEVDADATIAVTPVSKHRAGRFGVVHLDDSGRVLAYEEKPAFPKSNLASMTVYLFKTELLIRLLRYNAEHGKTFQIYDEILPGLVSDHRVFGYIHNGYWAYSRSVNDYFQANMDCLDSRSGIDISDWRLRTNVHGKGIGDYPPLLTGASAQIHHSVVSPGCRIFGTVKRSIISPLVTVDPGAVVTDSILFEGVHVRSGTQITRCIVDDNTFIGENATIGKSAECSVPPNDSIPELLDCGITLVGKNCRVPAGVSIGGNVLISPEMTETDFGSKEIYDSATLGIGG